MTLGDHELRRMWARDGFSILVAPRRSSPADVVTDVRHPDLQVQRTFSLATRDAHGLYTKFDWQLVEAGRFMRITRPYT
jgi:hypothetical protein